MSGLKGAWSKNGRSVAQRRGSEDIIPDVSAVLHSSYLYITYT